MKTIIDQAQKLLEKDVFPDFVIRAAMRALLKEKLRFEKERMLKSEYGCIQELLREMKSAPIALSTKEANIQHYEVPTQFYKFVLGKYMKYSSGYWKDGVVDFDQSQFDMLELSAQRAQLENGHRILELGCGWGSLSLFMAEKFPQSQIVGVSNSRTQKEYIDGQAKARGLKNLNIITADMNEFNIAQKFDRVVSVEMFEHMRNWQMLLSKVAIFLNDEGKLFIHIFTHKELAYFYEPKDKNDWMAQYFFTNGIMPSDHLLLYFQDHFKIQEHWRVLGMHYQKTSECWLKNMDQNKEKILPIFKSTYGEKEYKKWWIYWRVFFMACAELWGYDGGREWMVSHYLLKKR